MMLTWTNSRAYSPLRTNVRPNAIKAHGQFVLCVQRSAVLILVRSILDGKVHVVVDLPIVVLVGHPERRAGLNST